MLNLSYELKKSNFDNFKVTIDVMLKLYKHIHGPVSLMNKILLFLILPIMLVACTENPKASWIYTDEGVALWSTLPEGTAIKWNGNSFCGVANGSGVLTVVSPDGVSSQYNVSPQYGSISTDLIINVSSDEKYVGDVVDRKYTGFGVLLKQNEIYVGNFKNGKPDESLTLYKNGKLYYQGEWKEGAFDGEGSLHKEDGSVKSGIWKSGTLITADVVIDVAAGRYEGLVENGKPNGFGKLTYKNSAEYEGEWKDGLWNGIGQLSSPNDTIVSEWKNGVATGNASIYFDGFQYDGQLANNLPNGQGSLYSIDSNVPYLYAGEWLNGKRNGYGDALYSNGDTYYGEWKDDSYHGVGRYRYSNGDVYDGEWTDNLPNGLGQYISKAFKYGGEWCEGWIHGFGRIDFENGDIYEGDFCEGKKCGQGLYQYANGNVYEGEFFDDKINGLGVFTFADGNRYEGEFTDGKIHGNGTLYYADSTGIVTLTAFWDKPNEFPSEASIAFPNGDVYEGPLENGEPTSDGTWFHIDEKTGKTTFADKISAANDFYKEHKAVWNKVVVFTSISLAAIEIAATVAAPLTGGTSLIVASAAHIANTALNVADIAVAVGSASVDMSEAQTQEEKTAAAINLGTEVAVNAALILVPKALKSGPVKKITAKLSEAASNAVRKPIILLSKKKAVAKVISVVKNKEKKFVLALEKTKVAQKYYRATGKASYQYVTNDKVQKVIKNNPNVKIPEYVEGAAGNGGILGNNALQFMSDKARRRYNIERRIMGQRRAQWHHAIAGNKSNAAAEECRSILKKYRIDINDPRNAILLPVEPKSIMKGTIHGKHVNNYDEYVLNRLKQAVTPEQCLEVMDDIKSELYKGNLQLLIEHRVNTALRTVTRLSMY